MLLQIQLLRALPGRDQARFGNQLQRIHLTFQDGKFTLKRGELLAVIVAVARSAIFVAEALGTL